MTIRVVQLGSKLRRAVVRSVNATVMGGCDEVVQLLTKGHDPFPEHPLPIPPSIQRPRREILRAIRNCRVFVPLINEEWAVSGECELELNLTLQLHTHSKDKPRLPHIVPLSFPGLDKQKHDHVYTLAAMVWGNKWKSLCADLLRRSVADTLYHTAFPSSFPCCRRSTLSPTNPRTTALNSL